MAVISNVTANTCDNQPQSWLRTVLTQLVSVLRWRRVRVEYCWNRCSCIPIGNMNLSLPHHYSSVLGPLQMACKWPITYLFLYFLSLLKIVFFENVPAAFLTANRFFADPLSMWQLKFFNPDIRQCLIWRFPGPFKGEQGATFHYWGVVNTAEGTCL